MSSGAGAGESIAIRSWLRWITEPHEAVESESERLRIRLLSGFLLLLLIVFATSLLVVPESERGRGVLMTLVVGTAWILTRTRLHAAAAVLTVLYLAHFPFVSITKVELPPDTAVVLIFSRFSWQIVTIFVVGLYHSPRAALIFTALMSAAIVTFFLVTAPAMLPNTAMTLVFLALTGGLVALTAQYKRSVIQLLETRTEELAQANRTVSNAIEAKSRFLATISHELRTPLNAIIGMAELIDSSGHSEDDRDKLDTIRLSGASMLRLINEILDISMIEAGRLSLDAQPSSLRTLTTEAVSLVKGQAELKGLHLRSVVSDDVPDWVLCDPARLRQVLVNLLGNAVKFTDHGSVELALELDGSTESPYPLFRFSVSDTGIGIARDRMSELFDRFSRLTEAGSEARSGTGLGLSISKGIVDAMGGRIWVDSAPGQGSSFRLALRLPTTDPPENEAPPANAPETRSSARASQDAPARLPRILIVEDNEINRRVLQLTLQRLGFEPDEVHDGRAAVEAVGPGSYDVVFMDLRMPEMNGLEATAEIREQSGSSTAPWIIAVTADASPQDRDRCLSAGMNAYLSKPFTIEAIRDAIEAVPDAFD